MHLFPEQTCLLHIVTQSKYILVLFVRTATFSFRKLRWSMQAWCYLWNWMSVHGSDFLHRSLKLAAHWDPYSSMRCAGCRRPSALGQHSCEGVDWTGDCAQSRQKKPRLLYFIYFPSASARAVNPDDENRQCERPRGCFPRPGGEDHFQDAGRGSQASCPVHSSKRQLFQTYLPKTLWNWVLLFLHNPGEF